ncbi:MAG TPA: helix-turn-helix domain-containing protein [Candidatus Angelobacter sp.]|jgi:hypothetical protein
MNPKKNSSANAAKEPKDVRYIRKLFGSSARTFQTTRGGFVPLPIIYRKLFRKVSAPQLRVLVYLCTRASKYGLCYPTYEEIAHDLGLDGRKNLTPHIKELEKMGFITTASAEGKRFYLINDPIVPMEHLYQNGVLRDTDIDEINDLLETLKQPTIAPADLLAKPAKGADKP